MITLSLSMKRNCNLELRLSPSSSSSSSFQATHHSGVDHHHHHHSTHACSTEESNHESLPVRQPLTIFYNGRISVCDVTELQARAILTHAGKDVEQRLKTPSGSVPSSPIVMRSQINSPSPSPGPGPCPCPCPCPCPASGLSMKRSLQRFLQKRKNRIQATSLPYHR